MKHPELNEKQHEERNIFVCAAQENHWEINSDIENMFTNGISVSPEALAQIDNGKFVIQIALSIKEGMLIYKIINSVTEEIFSHLYLYYANIIPLLELILAEAPTIAEDTYSDFVRRLIPLCKMVMYVTQDKVYRIS
jgi:hypothetical protein